jgi:hypothetical protein
MISNKRIVKTIFSLILIVYIFSIVYAIISQRQFYADGAHFFINMVQYKTWMMDYPARQYGQYFTEFPIVFCMKLLHLENIYILSYIFGIGLYLPQIISLSICFYIVRNIDINYMLFPIVSLFGITQNMLFNMINDCIVITYVFWPILFFIIFVKKYNIFNFILLMFMALIFMRSYESASILGFVLLAVLFVEIYQNWRMLTIGTKLIWAVLALIMVNSIIIAVSEILNPMDPVNRSSFLKDIPSVLINYQVMLSAMYLLLISIYLLEKRFAVSHRFKFVAAILLLITIYYGFLPLIKPEWARPWLQHAARSSHLYMIPLLCVIACIVLKGIIPVGEISWKRAFILCAFLVMGQLTWQISMTKQWNGFRQVFKEELSNKEGYVQLEETKLVNYRIGNQLVRDMTWSWTNPSLSILWSKNFDVKTIVANPPECQWEPFNPQDIKSLPKLEKYGFSYEKYANYLKSHNAQK